MSTRDGKDQAAVWRATQRRQAACRNATLSVPVADAGGATGQRRGCADAAVAMPSEYPVVPRRPRSSQAAENRGRHRLRGSGSRPGAGQLTGLRRSKSRMPACEQ